MNVPASDRDSMERDNSDFLFSEFDSSVQETAGLASLASVTAAVGSPMFPAAAFAPSVYLTAAFGMPICVTARNN